MVEVSAKSGGEERSEDDLGTAVFLSATGRMRKYRDTRSGKLTGKEEGPATGGR